MSLYARDKEFGYLTEKEKDDYLEYSIELGKFVEPTHMCDNCGDFMLEEDDQSTVRGKNFCCMSCQKDYEGDE